MTKSTYVKIRDRVSNTSNSMETAESRLYPRTKELRTKYTQNELLHAILPDKLSVRQIVTILWSMVIHLNGKEPPECTKLVDSLLADTAKLVRSTEDLWTL